MTQEEGVDTAASPEAQFRKHFGNYEELVVSWVSLGEINGMSYIKFSVQVNILHVPSVSVLMYLRNEVTELKDFVQEGECKAHCKKKA